MKRIILIILVAIMGVSSAMSQNANRKGFFLEAAFGGVVGKTPNIGCSIDNYQLYMRTLSGSIFSLTFGPRFRISNHSAYECAIELQAPLKGITTQPAAKLYPVSFRFTTSEIFRNISLYGTLRVGGVVGFQGGGELGNILTAPNMPTEYFTFHSDDLRGGPAVSLGFGTNLTTHFYLGVTYDMNYFFRQYHGLKHENCLWGLLGARVGYRF